MPGGAGNTVSEVAGPRSAMRQRDEGLVQPRSSPVMTRIATQMIFVELAEHQAQPAARTALEHAAHGGTRRRIGLHIDLDVELPRGLLADEVLDDRGEPAIACGERNWIERWQRDLWRGPVRGRIARRERHAGT